MLRVGGAGHTATEQGVQALVALVANLENLRDIKLRQFLGGLKARVEGGPGQLARLLRLRFGRGPAEEDARLENGILERGRHLQAARLPVCRLATELIHLAAGEFHLQIIRLRALHQGGRGGHQESAAVHRPGHHEITAFAHVAMDRQAYPSPQNSPRLAHDREDPDRDGRRRHG